MKFFIILCAMALAAANLTPAHGRSVTFYSDGAMVELESSSRKGVIEVSLPSDMLEGSLRIKPLSGSAILRVDIMDSPADDGRIDKELDILIEQKNRLNDRLQALATREEIFKSAAKSQSGKAPRKSKSNPEPMQSIRQGTDFAIAQLEAVYTARRKTEQEIKRVDNRLSAAKNSHRSAARVARIVLSAPGGKISVRYAISNRGWKPRYDMYLNNSGSARVHLSGHDGGAFAGYQQMVSPAMLADGSSARALPLQAGIRPGIAGYTLAVSEELFGTGTLSSFSFVLKNTGPGHLPAGEANIYHSGEYVGRLRFEGLSSGRSRRVFSGQ